MKITKASIICFLLVPVFIWQADQIMKICAADHNGRGYTISGAEICNGDYRLFLINVCVFAALVCLFTAVFLIWKSRGTQEFKLLSDVNKEVISPQQTVVEDKIKL